MATTTAPIERLDGSPKAAKSSNVITINKHLLSVSASSSLSSDFSIVCANKHKQRHHHHVIDYKQEYRHKQQTASNNKLLPWHQTKTNNNTILIAPGVKLATQLRHQLHLLQTIILLLLVVSLLNCNYVNLTNTIAPEVPKLIPLSALESYEEGAELKLFCTASLTAAAAAAASSSTNDQQQLNSVNSAGNGGAKSINSDQAARQITFEWRKNDELLDDNYVNSFNHHYHQRNIGWPVLSTLNSSNNRKQQQQQHMIITQMDDTASMLKIINLTQSDRANYTCVAKNKNGQDSSSVRIYINVRLRWLKEPNDIFVKAGKPVQMECDASGQPAPIITWTRLRDSSTIPSRSFKIDRASINDSGLYECRASNAHHLSTSGDNTIQLNGDGHYLRKVIKLMVNVPARFNEKFSVVQAKGGESAKLECNATGDQPLTINWYKEDNIKLSKRGGENFEIYETLTTTGLNSVLVMRTVNRADGVIYKCIGENEFGNDEKLIKLVIVEVPSKPLNVRVKDVWSRSASLVWSSPFAGNSPITSYIIQYWKRQSVEQQQQQQTGVQAVALNHRRQEFTVSGSQTSALITNLNPALTYEASIIAENQVGRSEPSENIVISTGEEEPSSPPTDVTVEARGPSTIKVSWKVPPSESWNGKLQGFYIGFRPRNAPNSIDTHQPSAPQIIGQTSGSYSFKTVDAIKSQLVYESFLTNLMRGYEYEVIVKAFNNAGSGPDSHLMHVRTYDGDLPAPPTLFAHQTTTTTISVRWSYPSRTPTASIRRYTIYYQRQGDDSWLETGVSVDDKSAALQRLAAAAAAAAAANNQAGGNNNQQQEQQANAAAASAASNDVNGVTLTGLEPGFTYKIYAVAVNNFGMGDPSNIVTTKTEQLTSLNGEIISSSSSRNSNQQAADQFNMLDMNRQYQLFLLIPILCTIILVGFIISVVIFCSKRMQRPQNGGAGLPIQQAWGPNGTMQANSGYPTQRYVEFDKNIMKPSSAGSDQGSTVGGSNNVGHYPLPYGTLPMNAVVISDQKPWDQRPHSIMVKEPLKPQVTHTHIYDSPQ